MIPGNLMHGHLVPGRKELALEIASDAQNYNVYTAATSGGWDGTTPVNLTLTIDSGVKVYSSYPSWPALDTGDLWPAGSTINIINNGMIVGAGGVGGAGSATNGNGSGSVGGSGGSALLLSIPTFITNNGTIAGGGGGGGGGASISGCSGGGGGGGAGYYGGSYGLGGTGGTNVVGSNGNSGSILSPGTGGAGGKSRTNPTKTYAANGGNGGALGSYGSAGSNAYNAGSQVYPNLSGQGGAPGNAVIGNANATWLVVGTTYGPMTA